jgi:hypothetical protein
VGSLEPILDLEAGDSFELFFVTGDEDEFFVEGEGCVEGGGLAECFVGKNSRLGIVDEGGVAEGRFKGREF